MDDDDDALAILDADTDEYLLPDLHAEVLVEEVFVVDDRFEFDAPQFVDLVIEMRRAFGVPDAETTLAERPLEGWFADHHPQHESPVEADVSLVTAPERSPTEMATCSNSIQQLLDEHNRKIREEHKVLVRSRGADAAVDAPKRGAVKRSKRPAPVDIIKPGKRTRVQAVVVAPRETRSSVLSKAPLSSSPSKRAPRDTRSSVQSKLPLSSSPPVTSKKRARPGKENIDDEVALMLSNHNKQFKKAPVYVPRQHSTRDVRAWEKQTGNMWYTLTPAERETANMEMTAAKMTANEVPVASRKSVRCPR